MYTRPHENLIAWKEAHQLCLLIYSYTEHFPFKEKYRLVDQMCRSAYSAPTNIAEGNARHSKKERAYYLDISIGSIEELHYQSRLSFDLKYLSQKEFEEIDNRIHRVSYLLSKFRNAVLAM